MWNFHYFFAYTLLERVPGRNAKDFLEGGCRFFFFFFFCFQGTINFSEHLQCCLKVPRSARSAVFIRAISGNKRDKEKKKLEKKNPEPRQFNLILTFMCLVLVCTDRHRCILRRLSTTGLTVVPAACPAVPAYGRRSTVAT